MKKNYIYSYVKKICMRSTLIYLAALILIIIIVLNIPFTEVFNPSQMSYVASAPEKYKSGTEYVDITLHNAKYTGYDYIKHGKVYGSYYYCLVNNRCTFILLRNTSKNQLPELLETYSIKARLVPTDSLSEKMIKNFADDLEWTEDGLKKVSSDVVIDELAYHLDVYYYLAIYFIIMALILISFIIINIIYVAIPSLHPACMNFNRISHRETSIKHVNYELSSKTIMKSGNITLTENYIIATGFFNLEIVPIEKIVWAYEHSTWKRFLWFRIKLTYTLHLLCEHHIYIYSPRNTKEDIDSVLQYLQDYYPNIIFNYSKENKRTALKRIKRNINKNKNKSSKNPKRKN